MFLFFFVEVEVRGVLFFYYLVILCSGVAFLTPKFMLGDLAFCSWKQVIDKVYKDSDRFFFSSYY